MGFVGSVHNPRLTEPVVRIQLLRRPRRAVCQIDEDDL